MDVLTKTSALMSRLTAGAALIAVASDIVPRLVEQGWMSGDAAAAVLEQIPQLRDDLQRQIDAIAESIEGLQDRVEVLGQFLLLHRAALAPGEAAEVERLLAGVRG
jgi:hypothetical protein